MVLCRHARTTRFKRVDKHVIDYDKLSANEVRCYIGGDQQNVEKGLQRFSKGNIALAVILEDLHIKTTHGSQATGPNGGHVLCVVNTHILCDPGSADVKLWQAHLLLQTLKQMPIGNMPLLICNTQRHACPSHPALDPAFCLSLTFNLLI